jgi:type I restriction enzyme S subunit
MTARQVFLGDVADLLVGFAFKSAQFLQPSDTGIKLVRGDNVQQGVLRWGDRAMKWSSDAYDDFARYQLHLNDVLLAMDRPIVGGGLKLAWVKESDLPCLLVQRVTRIRGLSGVADTNYLRFALSAPDFTAHIDRITTGANIPHISGKDISAFSFRLPPLDEQLTIVEKLLAYDDLIENNRHRITLLEESARLLYREWFVHLRFPGAGPLCSLTGLPAGWRRAPLEEALFLQRGFDLPNTSRVPEGVPVYASSGVAGFHNTAKADGPGVVTGRSGTLGVVHYVDQNYWPLNTSLWVKEFRAVTPAFAYFLLAEMDLAQLNSGSTVPTLDRKVAHAQLVTIPTVDAVTEFEERVSLVLKQIKALEKFNATATEARDALLPKLMSGEIAV